MFLLWLANEKVIVMPFSLPPHVSMFYDQVNFVPIDPMLLFDVDDLVPKIMPHVRTKVRVF